LRGLLLLRGLLPLLLWLLWPLLRGLLLLLWWLCRLPQPRRCPGLLLLLQLWTLLWTLLLLLLLQSYRSSWLWHYSAQIIDVRVGTGWHPASLHIRRKCPAPRGLTWDANAARWTSLTLPRLHLRLNLPCPHLFRLRP
jgi:hypothetical protein